MNPLVKNKNVLVTGASGGIGQFIAIHVAMNGGTPILIARSSDKLKVTADILKNKYHVACHWHQADLSKEEEWKAVSDHIFTEHDRIDALINNAGLGVFEYFADTKWEDINRMIQVNITALLRVTHQVLPHMIAHVNGHIVNIASQSGKMATPKSAVYAATKHAVLGFTNALRMETADHGIYVTGVNLGPVRTDFFAQADPSGNYQRAVEPWMLDANQVAKRIVNQLFKKKREINLPAWMEAGSKLHYQFPGLTEKMLHKQFNKK
ncbi:SDR family NAD(P)-dependent oxidoreductase [Thalassobacillus devorans]|uniref:SDR family NAD(P)-dependent oxidoreductase n=1 Tax=Thalassobacillus devorans TaxID=279813 RepID=UPI00048AD919|nr:SDR family oxidoreductase [Thalassobacillus devorans]